MLPRRHDLYNLYKILLISILHRKWHRRRHSEGVCAFCTRLVFFFLREGRQKRFNWPDTEAIFSPSLLYPYARLVGSSWQTGRPLLMRLRSLFDRSFLGSFSFGSKNPSRFSIQPSQCGAFQNNMSCRVSSSSKPRRHVGSSWYRPKLEFSSEFSQEIESAMAINQPRLNLWFSSLDFTQSFISPRSQSFSISNSTAPSGRCRHQVPRYVPMYSTDTERLIGPCRPHVGAPKSIFLMSAESSSVQY